MPPTLPTWLVLCFVALVAWAVGSLLWALRRSGAARNPLFLIAGAVLWLAVPAVLAGTGRLAHFERVPPPIMLLFLPLSVFTVWLGFSRLGTALGAGLGMGALVGLQVFRLPLELVLHALHAEGALPVEMTYAGRNFDIASGAGALALLVWARYAEPPRRLLWLWAVLGLALLVNIASIAVLSFPAPFGWYEPANRIVAFLPWVWLPTVHVQLALFGHVVVLRRLWLTRRSKSISHPPRDHDRRAR